MLKIQKNLSKIFKDLSCPTFAFKIREELSSLNPQETEFQKVEGVIPELNLDPRLEVLHPRKITKYMKQNQIPLNISLVHAIAHIEYSASISYADTFIRFGVHDLEYGIDLLKVVDDEARHFLMLNEILEETGFPYPSLPVNKNIISDLERTEDSLEDRIAMISLTHEAKGLDAGPRLIQKLGSNKDWVRELEALTQIVEEEKSHVAFGVKWYTRLAQEKGSLGDGGTEFKDFLKRFEVFCDVDRINIEGRKDAGFNIDWLR